MKWRDLMLLMRDEVLQLLERAGRLPRQFFQIRHQTSRAPTWVLPVEIFETRSERVIFAALSGAARRRPAADRKDIPKEV